MAKLTDVTRFIMRRRKRNINKNKVIISPDNFGSFATEKMCVGFGTDGFGNYETRPSFRSINSELYKKEKIKSRRSSRDVMIQSSKRSKPNLRDTVNPIKPKQEPWPYPVNKCCIENTCEGNIIENAECSLAGSFCTETTWSGGCENPG